MATTYSSDLTKEIVKATNLQQGKDTIPTELARSIVPVIDVNPKKMKVISKVFTTTLSNATSVTLATIDSDKEFYMTGASVAYIKDATATATQFQIQFTNNEDNLVVGFMRIPHFTLTAGSGNMSVDLSNHPIKIKRGTTIQARSDTNVANFSFSVVLWGFYLDSNG